MSGFAQALPFVLRIEGGYVFDPKDRGGATSHGITQATYNEWRESVGFPPKPVQDITAEEVEAIYHVNYWVAAKCDALPWPLSLGHFDAAVNHGSRAAWRIMQRALKVMPDGVPGPLTMRAIENADPTELRWRWLKERASFYTAIVQGDETQVRFLRGWLNRLFDLHREMAA